jgi:hypothetical protein
VWGSNKDDHMAVAWDYFRLLEMFQLLPSMINDNLISKPAPPPKDKKGSD